MVEELELSPVHAGVVYSPGGQGWRFYPEPVLSVGVTGSAVAQTDVRSILSFAFPDLGTETFILNATLRLRLIRNEPPTLAKSVCLREIPTGMETPWTLRDEYNQPVLAAHYLSAEVSMDLDSDLTGLAVGWQRGAPNRGVLLDFGTRALGLVSFAGCREDSGPRFKISYVHPAPDLPVLSVEVEPDASRESRELPCRDLIVKNLGPGLAWISLLYLFDSDPPADPAGMALSVLWPGSYAVLTPKMPARGLRVRVATALNQARVIILPVSPAGSKGV